MAGTAGRAGGHEAGTAKARGRRDTGQAVCRFRGTPAVGRYVKFLQSSGCQGPAGAGIPV